MTQIRRLRSRWTPTRQALHEAIAERTEKAAEDLRDYIAQSLDAGEHGLDSDTHALAKSLYVKATGRDDYNLALDAARAAFKGNPSRYRGKSVSQKAEDNFEALVAPNEPIAGDSPHLSVCIVSTMLAYGWKWELASDRRPWMLPPTLEWASTRLAGFYRDLQISL